MKTNLQTIKEAVIAAVPEIMELKFGCEVMVKDDNFAASRSYSDEDKRVWKITSQALNDQKIWTLSAFYGYEQLNFSQIERFCEILGRPIRLADVLYALNAHGEIWSVNGSGKFESWKYEGQNWSLARYGGGWNLRKDDLREQSEGTLAFLADSLT